MVNNIFPFKGEYYDYKDTLWYIMKFLVKIISLKKMPGIKLEKNDKQACFK